MLAIAALLASSILSVTHAVKLPLTRRAQSSPGLGSALSEGDNLDTKYFVEIELGGQSFKVLIDTGSSDLWLSDVGPSVKLTNTTNVPVDITYGDESGVSGTVAFSELQLGQFTVPSQAFIKPNHVNITSNLLQEGDGLIGLSFDTHSEVNRAIQSAYGNGTTIGRTPLSNIFAQDPAAPNCVDMHLNRAIDVERVANGTLLIGEHSEEYSDISKQPVLYTIEETEWTVMLDGMTVDGKSVTLGGQNSSSGVATSSLPVLLDSGTSFAVITDNMFNAIYESIPGAVLTDTSQWTVPCLSSTNVSFSIGGLDYPIHPLDLTIAAATFDDDEQANGTVCVSLPFKVVHDIDDFAGELILGDFFLKNVYASFNFGNLTNSSTPNLGSYVQLLSTTNTSQAWADFLKTRSRTLQALLPGGGALSSATQVTSSAASLSSSSQSSITSMSTIPSTTQLPVGNAESTSSSVAVDESPSKALGALAEDTSNSDDPQLTSLVKKYGVTALGLLAANLIVGLILCIIGVMTCLRGKRESRRTVNPTYAPVRFKESESESVVEGVRYED
ncbi:aspartic peptidase domain-containing protein [Irpex lacteus]|nr:aspartic peptidase domain-containing protein [Irpex lacteus]